MYIKKLHTLFFSISILYLFSYLNSCVLKSNEKQEKIEQFLGFPLPPSASELYYKDLDPAPFDDRVQISFTINNKERNSILSELPCNPSASGTLHEMSDLIMSPLTSGELICTQTFTVQNWITIRITPIGNNQTKVAIEQYEGY